MALAPKSALLSAGKDLAQGNIRSGKNGLTEGEGGWVNGCNIRRFLWRILNVVQWFILFLMLHVKSIFVLHYYK